MGPFNQVKKMFAPTRAIATIIVFVSFGLTLFAAIGVSYTFFNKILLHKQYLKTFTLVKLSEICFLICLKIFFNGEKVYFWSYHRIKI